MTPDWTIRRHEEVPGYATYGRFFRYGTATPFAVALERPWVDKDKNGKRDRGVSRIAPGIYEAYLRRSHKNGGTGKRDYDVYEFLRVPDTDNAQVHIANEPRQLEGCVAIGTEFAMVDPHKTGRAVPGIAGSKAAHDRWLAANKGKERIVIEIVDAFPGPVAALKEAA